MWDASKKALRAAGVITIIILLVSLGISSLWPWSLQRQMSAYTDHWNDISYMRNDLKRHGYEVGNILTSPRILDASKDWNRSVLFIAGVERPYSEDEIKSIKSYVRSGGNVVLADDTGFSKPLLNALAGDVRTNHSRLYSQTYLKNPDFVLASGYIDSGPVIDKSFRVMCNRPATFEGTIPGMIFFSSDEQSWLDANNNNEKDLGEEAKSYVMGFFFSTNAFLSDPSIFINDMWVREQNAQFGLAMLLAMLPDGGKVIFEESRHISSDQGEQVQKTIYSAFVFMVYDIYSKAAIIAVCIICVLIYMRFVRLPTDWRHLPNLEVPWYLNYSEGGLTGSDALRIRNLIENKVRVVLRMSPGEFKLKKKAILDKVLTDPDLQRFMSTWTTYKRQDLEHILEKARCLEIDASLSIEPLQKDQEGGTA